MIYSRYDDRETLERLKRWPKLKGRFPEVRIYSAEHGAFWRGSGQGYTCDSAQSDIWPCDKAFEATRHCCEQKRIQFVAA